MTTRQPLRAKLSAKDRLIVALDLPDKNEVLELVDQLGDEVTFYKINHLRMFDAGGVLPLLHELRRRGKNVFLDAKYWDIPQTISSYVRLIVDHEVKFLTVYPDPGIVGAASDAARGSELQILAVTVLTSMDLEDVRGVFGGDVDETVEDRVARLANELLDSGCHGVIASALEAERLARLRVERDDPGVLIVTPGIRLPGANPNDHKRTSGPYDAIKAGADYVVAGRPIYQAPDPVSATRAYIAEIQRGLGARG